MRLRTILLAVLILGGSFAGATVAMQWLAPRPMADRRPALAPPPPPLPPISRTSVIVAPASVAISAIREAMEREAPRTFSGKRDNPVSHLLSNSEVGWTATRGPLALTGRPDGLIAGTVVNGALRATGQISQRAAGNVGSAISGLLGQDVGRSVERLAGRTLDQRADIRGNVMVAARPALTGAWRLEPNLAAQVSVADANLSIAGVRLNVANEVRPYLERSVNEQIAALEARLRNDPFLERAGRREWAKLCRSIPLAAAAGLPNLWLEVRPKRAFATQPRIDTSAVILTLGVEAETRIVPSQTTPECPFPSNLEIVAHAEEGRVNIAVPIDLSFVDVNRLIAAKLAGTKLPADNSGDFDITIKSAEIVPSGDRLLISLRVTANEKRSWFGFGADATIYIWGRPALERGHQVVRLADITLDVESEAAFGLIGVAARAATSYLLEAISERAVIDLKPFADNARQGVETAMADFRTGGDGVQVDTNIADLRLVEIAFDANTLRVIAEADGTANVTVTSLPGK